MIHKGMFGHELAKTLREMAAAVEAGDSFEGSIEYLMPQPLIDSWPGPGNHPGLTGLDEYAVRASYRVGNSMGQGGVVLFGADDTRMGAPLPEATIELVESDVGTLLDSFVVVDDTRLAHLPLALVQKRVEVADTGYVDLRVFPRTIKESRL